MSIPTYFYTKLELKSYNSQQKSQTLEFAKKIQSKIYEYSLSNSKHKFVFPKSFKFDVKVLSKHRKIIYESINKKHDIKKLRIEIVLPKNKLNAKYLIVKKNISYLQIYLKILLLCFCIFLFMFVSIYLIIQASIDPFKRANEYLDSFFNDAMHELKTPLGVIQLNLEILDEKQPKTKEIYRSINATKNLFLVYEDIEYLIKQKSVKYNKEQIEFDAFLKQRIDQFDSLLTPKNLSFNVNIEQNLIININRTHLQRLIDNTISNAIKYSFKNSEIKINLKKDEENKLVFSVHNFANEIKNINDIFNRYYKEDHIKGGFGIGLNIVKNICEYNNIKIEVNSSEKEGTCFKYIFLNFF
ncbi:HAMP domain-containing sensor histidine kinase [Arcobacter sp. CECT 8985]|uniref:sensor histidine kinase n=1 Tax=Arcobacter sp. CECT 8985 TaxID=1935424 RepID=UPI00100AD336|nr:HAMP domain-containing sensor histidine kinase [Arcobacter sp. CECT 8985]RXJ87377.1 two-component sensor histidine kinase [Arcobacter sp. CECT 8985]